MIWSIRRGYGVNCEEFESECSSCQAKKIIDWLEKDIKLIKS